MTLSKELPGFGYMGSCRILFISSKVEGSTSLHGKSKSGSREPVSFFCCSVSFVVGSLKDESGRRVSE